MERLEGLERRVERLTSVLMIQSALLAVVVLLSVLKAAPYLVATSVIAIVLLVTYRRSWPQWLGMLSRSLQRFQHRSSGIAPQGRPPSSEPSSS